MARRGKNFEFEKSSQSRIIQFFKIHQIDDAKLKSEKTSFEIDV